MWDCESPTPYLYGAGITAVSGFLGAGVPVSVENTGLHGPTSNSFGSVEVYAGTANSLANFCTNITETDDALKQVRGGGFLAEFEKDEDDEEAAGMIKQRGGRSSSNRVGEMSPHIERKLYDVTKCHQSDIPENDDLHNGSGIDGHLWVRTNF